jgi:hypothetical protein
MLQQFLSGGWKLKLRREGEVVRAAAIPTESLIQNG